jgi:hypothetical protein
VFFFLRRDSETEALARYVDAVIAGVGVAPGPVEAGLDRLVRALRTHLHGQEPDPAFTASLRVRLLAAADQRAPVPVPLALWRQPRFIIGAAGVFSAAAILAFVARSRLQSAARAA